MARDVPKEVIEMLGAISLFAGCDRKELGALAGLGTQLPIAEGTEMTRQGAHGAELVIIIAGSARCLVDGTEVARFGPGDFFGEMSLIDNGPRSATVVADSRVDALILNAREFKSLVDVSPDISWKMLVALAGRLREADESINS
jgi:CRP/FNR family transcriptional regulator, cyclic AMP receptor protein